MTDDEKTKAPVAHLFQFVLHLYEPGNILLDRESADKSQHLVAVVVPAVSF